MYGHFKCGFYFLLSIFQFLLYMALYHKHRPQRFSTIIGQEPIVTTLTNQIRGNRLAHAYLFCGPRGVGKTTSARVLAKAINCANRGADAEPCDTCQSCIEITGSRSIDVIEMDAASHTSVDNVREEIIAHAQFLPTKSRYKIFIIDEVHMLSTSAFNALLKILEEPPAHMLFILATTELQKLPDTVISRCQRFTFKKIRYDVLFDHLQKIMAEEGVSVDPDVLAGIVRRSDGCARDAVSLFDQLLALGETHITADIASLMLPVGSMDDAMRFIQALIVRDTAAAILGIRAVMDAGGTLTQFATDAIEVLRSIILIGSGISEGMDGIAASEVMRQRLTDMSKQITNRETVTLIDLIVKRRSEIKSSPVPQLPLELAAIEWCGESGIRPARPKPGEGGDQGSGVEGNGIHSPLLPDCVRLGLEEGPLRHTSEGGKEGDVTIDQIRGVWDKFLQKVETESPSLVFILKMTELIAVRGTILVIRVPYRFHMDTLTKKTNAQRLQELLSELLGTHLQMEVDVAESLPDRQAGPSTPNADIQELATVFGGEVVG